MFDKLKWNIERKMEQIEQQMFKEFLEQHPEVVLPNYMTISECLNLVGRDNFHQYTEEEKLYLLDSFKVTDVEGYSIYDVSTIISDKFSLLDSKEFEKKYLFDVTKIYLLLNSKEVKRPTTIYQEFVKNYRNVYSDTMFQGRKDTSILLNAIESSEKLLKEMNQEQKEKFLKLGPTNMSFIRQYFRERSSWDKQFDEKEAICDFLNPLTISQIETLSNFPEKKFKDLLDHCTLGSNKHSLLFGFFDNEFLQDEKASIPYDQLFSAIEHFPDYFLEILNQKDFGKQISFLNHIKVVDADKLVAYNHSLHSVPEEYRDCVGESVIENEDFRNLSSEKMEMIFMELCREYFDNNKIRYLKCLKFLVPFALEVSPKVLDITKTFLCRETDKEILATKIKAVENVKKDIVVDNSNLDASEYYYELYMELLQGSDNLSKKQQLKQLRARSSYFENHPLEDVFGIDAENFSRFHNLLNSDTGRKHHNQSYRLMELNEQYKTEVVEAVIQQLENVSSGKRAKQIMDYITQDVFIKAPYEEQRNQLKNLPGQMVSLEQDGITVDICDIGSLDTGKEEVIFTNKDTGAKVKVKCSNSKK